MKCSIVIATSPAHATPALNRLEILSCNKSYARKSFTNRHDKKELTLDFVKVLKSERV
jgi:hypothetical protein